MFIKFLLTSLNIAWCLSLATYHIFPGFDSNSTKKHHHKHKTTTEVTVTKLDWFKTKGHHTHIISTEILSKIDWFSNTKIKAMKHKISTEMPISKLEWFSESKTKRKKHKISTEIPISNLEWLSENESKLKKHKISTELPISHLEWLSENEAKPKKHKISTEMPPSKLEWLSVTKAKPKRHRNNATEKPIDEVDVFFKSKEIEVINVSNESPRLDNPNTNNKKRHNSTCPEDESPISIGPYEVPTQRDLALQAIKTLKKMFARYHQKALILLQHIKKASISTKIIEGDCQINKVAYKKCVNRVTDQSNLIVNGLINSLESHRTEIGSFTEKSICSISELKTDPVQLIKILAMEGAMLDFALPAYLRMLNSCRNYCLRSIGQAVKPLMQHDSNSDLVVMHFLSRKPFQKLY